MKVDQSYDVVILGAGVAGCATALSMMQLSSDLKILIIDRKASDARESKNPDVRVGETLPPHTAARLQELGLWKEFQKTNFQRS